MEMQKQTQGDLISREETLKAVTDAVGKIVEKAFYSTLSIPELREAINKSIKEQPTAYDVDKVVEQVNELWKRPVFDKAGLESVIRKGAVERLNRVDLAVLLNGRRIKRKE